MKKYFLGFIVSICFIIMTSCAIEERQQLHYNSYISDMANDGIILEAEKDWWSGKHELSTSVEKEKDVLFQNKDFKCNYLYSIRSLNSPFQINVYCDDNGKAELYFDANTGEFTGLHFYNILNVDSIKKEDINEADARELAKKYAKQYIDLDKYEITVSELSMGSEEEPVTLFNYEFVRFINGWRTGDRMIISITSKGDLRTFHVENAGLFEGQQNLFIDRTALENSIKTKLDFIYSNYSSYSYEIVKQTVTYSPDRQLAVVSQIELELTTDGESFPSGVVLTTIIND